LNLTESVWVEIIDLSGRVVLGCIYEGQIDVCGLSSGTYIVRAGSQAALFVK
jgi:hypothetical protein